MIFEFLNTVVGHLAKMFAMICRVALFLGKRDCCVWSQLPDLAHTLRRNSRRMIFLTVWWNHLRVGFVVVGINNQSSSPSGAMLIICLLVQMFPMCCPLCSDMSCVVWSCLMTSLQDTAKRDCWIRTDNTQVGERAAHRELSGSWRCNEMPTRILFGFPQATSLTADNLRNTPETNGWNRGARDFTWAKRTEIWMSVSPILG